MKTNFTRILALGLLFLTKSIVLAQTLVQIYPFAGTNEINPHSLGLLLSNNTLYGSVFGIVDGGGGRGSTAPPGALFKLNVDGSGFPNIHAFTEVNSDTLTNLDGANPQAPLALSGGKLYGVTENGGLYANGVVFALNTDGTGFTNLYDFSSPGVADGSSPSTGLLLVGDTLYGATTEGGSFGSGTLFAIRTDGTGFTNFYNFTMFSGANDTNADGFGAKPGLLLSGNRLFGTTTRGGATGNGVIFSVNTNGSGFTNLHSFSPLVRMTTPPYLYTNVDGNNPGASLAFSGNTLYGVATIGGANTNNSLDAGGTIFAVHSDGSGFATLHNFGGNDGADPESLILSGETIYGAAHSSGFLGQGCIFSMNLDGSAFSTPEIFPPEGYDSVTGAYTNLAGYFPVGNIVLSGNALYGATEEGGTNGAGILFALDIDVSPPPIHFDASPSNGPARLAVQFTSPSTDSGLVAWTWNFGDGAVPSSLPDPTHTYTNAGVYLPSLSAINGYGNAVTSSGPVITVSPPPPIQFTATPSNGVPAPVTVHFTSPSADTAGIEITSWKWNFGDGFTNGAQNPSHTYSNSGSFFPSLSCVNYNGDAISAVGPAVIVPLSLLSNGGFEAGSLSNWTLGGYSNLTRITTAANFVHSGKYGVELYAPSSKGTFGLLSQSFVTTPGTSYLISLWLDVPTSSTPNDFQISWNGSVLLDETNLGNTGWTNIQLAATAASSVSTLQFGFLTGTLYFGLDDVVVTAAAQSQLQIASISLSGTDLIISANGGQSGHACRLLTSPDLSLPLNQWAPVATNLLGADGNFSITATNALDLQAPRRFYSLQMQ